MKTLGSIESFTGGLFAATITAKANASVFFKGSIVTYQNEIKAKLGIDISQGVVNAKTALAMAKSGKLFLNVDYCVAFTGIAGPATIENKPVGTAFIAINDQVFKCSFSGTRTEIQHQAVNFALQKLTDLKVIN